MANLIFSILSEYNGKGLAKGKKDVLSFEKSIKNLGKALGVTFSAAAIVNFSKKAINAFMQDEAAAKSLELQLKNTGYAFSTPDIEYYIANLQKMTGVLDDHLRPAFQTLLTASGSITKSQKALAIALDISAATGKSVEEVSAAIAKGYTGQTTALARLGAGIDKTTLASGDMNLILDEASRKFSGQALARLTTYAGKMDQLKVATANASEIIGKDLLDSLSAFSKDDTLSGFDDLLSGLATKLASIDKAVFGFVARLAGIKKQSVNFTYSLGANAGNDIARAKEAKLIKDANKLRAAENAALTKKTAVDQLKDKFDLERIGLMAALDSATDNETKLRLRSQLAILDNNEALAKKYLAEMNAAEAAKKLATDLTDAGDKAYQAFNGLLNLLGRGGDQGPGQAQQSFTTNVVPSLGAGQIGGPSVLLGSGGDQGPGRVTVNIDASNMVDSANMARVVQQAFLEINKNGYSTVPAGQGF